MPRALNPNATVELILPGDRKIDPPPTFVFKALTVSEEDQLALIYDAEFDKKSSLTKRVQEALEPFIVAYKNMGDRTPETEPLSRFINSAEAFDLANQLMSSGRLDLEAKKKSELQVSSAPVSSADLAPPQPAENNSKT